MSALNVRRNRSFFRAGSCRQERTSRLGGKALFDRGRSRVLFKDLHMLCTASDFLDTVVAILAPTLRGASFDDRRS